MKNISTIFATVITVAVAFISCNQPTTTDQASQTEQAAVQPSEQEQNKKAVTDWIDAVNSRQFDKVLTVFADNYVYHPNDTVRGPQKAVAWVKSFVDGFDIKLKLVHLVAEGDLVNYHMQVTGKQIAPFGGMPASNKDISVETIGIVRMENGKVAEEWEIFEEMKMLQQIGAMPAQ